MIGAIKVMSKMTVVDILLPTFYPRRNFLVQQLRSLNEQTYPALRVLILDDSGDVEQLKTIRALCQNVLTRIPYEITSNRSNLGINRSFEKLLLMAKGKIVAFCDQDDIWEREKIHRLVKAMEKKNAHLAYCGAKLINDRNEPIRPTWKSIGFSRSGERLYKFLVGPYSIGGNRIVVFTELARRAIPFIQNMSYDHWVSLISSCYGRLIFVNEPLICYRLHDRNALGIHRILSNLHTKAEYAEKRIRSERRRCDEVIHSQRLPPVAKKSAILYSEWVKSRFSVFSDPNLGAIFSWIAGYRWCPKLFGFELMLVLTPARLVKKLFKWTTQDIS